MSFQQAFEEVKILVNDFKNNENYYVSPAYSEAQVRQDFIDKFFTTLGWDVAHNFQKNPFEQEVKVEKPQRQEGMQSQKRADYAFALEPNFKQTQFFVEAKKPSRLLRQNRDDYFQTAKYGWNSQTGISILTDFQEFVIIDCRFKPDFETILNNQIKYYNYQDFLKEEIFAEIYFLFSREAVSEGKLRIYIDQLPKPKFRGKQLKLFGGKLKAIDEDFLEYIDEIRKNLALAFYQNNPNLEDYELTEATQRTIDRLVFMRFLEDKQIEPDDVMHHIATAQHPWQKFVETCKRFNAKYNGIIFKEHFIDNDFLGANEELFRSICQDLDHTNTPYDFNYFPIHILGNIYERFLGKVITIENGKANIELKPEVRKAGGVFYTPKYIVDYIVENTVGKLIADKSPKQISTLTFADIACGSGSFLIGVYEYLLDYHLKYYNENPNEAKKANCIYSAENHVYVLSIKQKQQILTNNVFGVDIDQQATEVTQVSLFLKLLEDESMATANDMNVLFAEKILPDLSGNIKCGNSLIGWEIMDGQLFEQKELRKLNPFDFEQAFPKVFSQSSLRGTKQSGFDAIVGNPPYVKVSEKLIFDFLKLKYKHQNYQLDLYLIFLERYHQLLSVKGLVGVIIPNTWLQSITFTSIRKYLVNDFLWHKILHSKKHIFDAVVDTHVLIFEKNNLVKENLVQIDFVENEKVVFYQNLKQNSFPINGEIINILAKPEETDLFNKIKRLSSNLFEICQIFNGVKPFEKGKGNPPQSQEIMTAKPFVVVNQEKPLGENWFPLMRGSLMNKYINYWNNDSWIQYGEWLAAPRKREIFDSEEKIIVRQTSDRIIATTIGKDIICRNNLHILISENINHNFILGVLNSKLTDFYYHQINPEVGEVLAEVKKTHVEQLPIPKITPENQKLHDDMVVLVDQMLKAKEDEQHAKTAMDKSIADRRCENLDFRINEIVYKLYGLSREEILLVEKNS